MPHNELRDLYKLPIIVWTVSSKTGYVPRIYEPRNKHKIFMKKAFQLTIR